MSYVRPIGPRDAKIVIVGEAPGEIEAQRGEPFVGASGKLLTHLLAQVGILRKDCYITNVIKERPPGNNIKPIINLTLKHPKISDKGDMYLRQFQNEMSKLSPNVIIPVGNIGLWALTGKIGVLKWRSSILSSNDGRKVIPTIHPAAALRDYNLRYLILKDLKRISIHKDSPNVPTDHRKYIVRPNMDTVNEYLDSCEESKLCAFDIECTRRGEVTCISFSYHKDHAISIPFIENRSPYFYLPEEAYIWKRIANILENPDIKKIAHNATFDSTILYRRYGIRTQNIHDTMVAEGMIHPDFRKGLGPVTAWWTTMTYYKDEGKESFKSQDNEQFWVYNAKDSCVLMEAYPKMIQELTMKGNLDSYENQCKLIPILLYMTEHGLNVDHEALSNIGTEVSQQIKEKIVELNQIAGYPLNHLSPKQLIDYFYKVEGYAPYKSRTTGKPTVDEKALKRLARKGAKAASIILELRGLSKLSGTYLEVKLGEDKRLRASYNPIGTRTLRLSSSKDIAGVGLNLQTLPPRMKQNIIPDEGYVAFEIDLAQAENRIVAYIAPDQRMIGAFEQGLDVHSLTAGFIFNKEPEEIKDLDKEWNSLGKPIDAKYCAPIGQGNLSWRYWGKQANHSSNYGLGYKSAALRWEIPENQAKMIQETYHRTYPGVHIYQRWVQEALRKTRTVSNLFGYKRTFISRWEDSVKNAYAFIPQSTVAEIINRRGLQYIFYNTKMFSDVEILNQIHDSVVFQVPLSIGWLDIANIIENIKTELETPLIFRGRQFTIPADIKMMPVNLNQGVDIKTITPHHLRLAYESQFEQVR